MFLDRLGLKWEYETQGYELPSGRYLPDFYLRDAECWLEVKPDDAVEVKISQSLCRELCEATENPVLIGVGLPFRGRLYLFTRDCASGSALRWECWWGQTAENIEPRHGEADSKMPPLKLFDVWNPGLTNILDAAECASMARFEFGETPAAVDWRKELGPQPVEATT